MSSLMYTVKFCKFECWQWANGGSFPYTELNITTAPNVCTINPLKIIPKRTSGAQHFNNMTCETLFQLTIIRTHLLMGPNLENIISRS